MLETLTIEGKKYMTLAHAGQHFGYTKEYLQMLLKESKFDARKISGKWYVDIDSAHAYFDAAQEALRVKRDALRGVRKQEYMKKTKSSRKTHHHVALLETSAIIVIGLVFGIAGYVGTTPVSQTAALVQADTSFFKTLARSVYSLIEGDITLGSDTQPVLLTTTTPAVMHTATSAVANQGTSSALVIAPVDSFTGDDVAAIRDSFSDTVIIERDLQNPDTGVITPVFREGKHGDEYRYLVVPVKQE